MTNIQLMALAVLAWVLVLLGTLVATSTAREITVLKRFWSEAWPLLAYVLAFGVIVAAIVGVL